MKKIIILLITIIFSLGANFVYAKNLDVNFFSQSPDGYWGQPWQDACEETVIAMLDNFYRNTLITENKNYSKSEILRILNIKNNHLGYSLDENAKKMVEIINQFLPWEARTIKNPTLEQIKKEIDEGRPIILPVYGKMLYNPHFVGSGPQFHTVIISGYDEDNAEFITQEPGTKYGRNYRYSYTTLLNANHDFLPAYQTKNGEKIAIFTQKNLDTSISADGDDDGLNKSDEIKYGTITWLYDSDGDSFSDGNEVKNGFLPNVNENNFPNRTLIKGPDSPKVFLLENKQKRHIANETVFLNNNWKWTAIKTISQNFINNIPEGSEINK